MGEWVSGSVGTHARGRSGEWIDGWMDEWVGGWVGGWMGVSGWMGG